MWGYMDNILNKIELVDGVVSIVGPNAETQYAAEIQIGAIARMPSGTAQSLVDEGCILTDDVTRAKMILAAWTRMEQAGSISRRPLRHTSSPAMTSS